MANIDTHREAIPWYKSVVLNGSLAGLMTSLVAVVQAYNPNLPFSQQLDTLWPLFGMVASSLATLIGRITSTAQPLTTSQDKADKITQVRAEQELRR